LADAASWFVARELEKLFVLGDEDESRCQLLFRSEDILRSSTAQKQSPQYREKSRVALRTHAWREAGFQGVTFHMQSLGKVPDKPKRRESDRLGVPGTPGQYFPQSFAFVYFVVVQTRSAI
jgi:hypothetical protein